MAHRDNRSYYQSFQRHYRDKNFKAVRAAAWVVLTAIVLLCAALIVR